MLTKILFYAYCIGVYSSRKIAERLEDSVFFMYLSAMQRPDFRTISDFRKNHLKELSEFFVQVLRMCQEIRMIKFGHISLDALKQVQGIGTPIGGECGSCVQIIELYLSGE